MAKKTEYSNYRLTVWVPDLEDGRMASRADNLRAKIIKHLDYYDHAGIGVGYDTDVVCEHCGAKWTEASTTYNGGCCDEDEKANRELAREEV